ncbi:hypothetical protein J6590_072879 [Homalodisca vitripennis]|nr:hypothetical protein J6590_072879 [Homalodisca vitripennis]
MEGRVTHELKRVLLSLYAKSSMLILILVSLHPGGGRSSSSRSSTAVEYTEERGRNMVREEPSREQVGKRPRPELVNFDTLPGVKRYTHCRVRKQLIEIGG